MKEKIIGFFTLLIFGFAIWFLVSLFLYEKENDKGKWNGGYCPCGNKWEFYQAVGHYSSTTYLYKCPNCGAVIELFEYQN